MSMMLVKVGERRMEMKGTIKRMAKVPVGRSAAPGLGPTRPPPPPRFKNNRDIYLAVQPHRPCVSCVGSGLKVAACHRAAPPSSTQI